MAEVRWAARHAGYRIARISSLMDNSADICILSNVDAVCARLLQAIASLPQGISIDSFEVQPALFAEVMSDSVKWGADDS
jgi:hypothetical protein